MFNTEKRNLKKLKSQIEKSGLFDKVFYLKTYHDVRIADITPIEHYVKFGIKEDRKPNKDFDPIWYKEYYQDVKENGAYPLIHFILFGNKENRFTNEKEKNNILNEPIKILKSNINLNQIDIKAEFNEIYYLQNNHDVKKEGINAFEHYINYGWKEARNPNEWFDVNFYLENNIDIKNANIEPLSHYLLYGRYEGRLPKSPVKEYIEIEYDTLINFGYSFYGPIFSVFFKFLNSYVVDNNINKLYFLAREGYFLKHIYDELSKKGIMKEIDTEYLLVSRAFLFRLLLLKNEDLSFALQSNFRGTLEYLLKYRFALSENEIKEIGFTDNELSLHVSLPDTDKEIENLLKLKISKINIKNVEASFHAYSSYLNEIGFLKEENPIVVDLGYAGTIQKLLSSLYSKDISGIYFINSNKSKEINVGRNKCSFNSCFKQGVSFGDGYPLLEKSLVLEGLLTSPQGQLRNILRVNGKTKSIHGIDTISQKKFHYLTAIVKGAMDFIIEMHESGIDSRNYLYEIEKLFDVGTNQLNKDLLSLIELDDYVSGFNVINPAIVIKNN